MTNYFTFGGMQMPTDLLSGNLFVQWRNGCNPNTSTSIVTQVFYGTEPGNLTNFITVPFSQTNAIISNVLSATRYWAAAKHVDKTNESILSLEDNGKTTPNPPRIMSITR